MTYRPAELLLAMYRRFGPVVRFGRYVYLLGPDANRFVFANSHLFRWREAYEALVPVDGPTALIVSDGEEHQRRRRSVQPALHHNRTYLERTTLRLAPGQRIRATNLAAMRPRDGLRAEVTRTHAA